jgi:hypothetical protein
MPGGFDVQGYLLHSLVVAGVARQLGVPVRQGRGRFRAIAYVAGPAARLRQDRAGAVHRRPSSINAVAYSPPRMHVPLHEAEKLGHRRQSRPVVGAMLAKSLDLPRGAGRLHPRPSRSGVGEPSALMDCLRVADQVVRYREVGDSGNPWRDTEALAAPERFGDDIVELMAKLGSFDKIVEDATMFAQVGHEK